MILRPYQTRTIESLWSWFRTHPDGHPIVEACVGSGKSVMIAETIRQALEYPHTRVLMCVASRELCRQNADRLTDLWPGAPVGIYSAGLRSRVLDSRIVYATIGSIWRRWKEIGHVDLLMIDEVHNVSAKDQGMYRTLIRDLSRICPGVRVVGWTGTAFHGSGVWIHDAEEALFTDIAARVGMRELLDEGYLAPLVSPRTDARLSADGVRMMGGDFIVSQLARAIDRDDLTQQCADELIRLGADRQRWFVFGATVAHCEHIAAALRQRGIACAVVSATTPTAERDDALAALKAGRLRALVNVACLTTGIDIPSLDLICLMRNTRSPVLFVQIAGRGMRTAPGKTDCLFVDFTDSLEVLGPVDLIKGKPRKKSQRDVAPFKLCPECGARNAAAAMECRECGAPFEIEPRPALKSRASVAPVLSSQAPIAKWVPVSHCHYRHHQATGKPASLRVDYWGGMARIASEWVCLEHGGYARARAMAWWLHRCPHPPPNSVMDALSLPLDDMLRRPKAVQIKMQGKYPEIVSYEF